MRRRLLFLIFLLFPALRVVRAQQPFNTDDADVTDHHRWHLEVANEFGKRGVGAQTGFSFNW